MRLYTVLLFFAILISSGVSGQTNHYKKSLKAYRKNYKLQHEAVKGRDRKGIRFFPVNNIYLLKAAYIPTKDTAGFMMRTSGKNPKKYFDAAVIQFKLKDSIYQLKLYRSETLMQKEGYEDYLFLPFTDLTCIRKSYGGGRYLDLSSKDIINDSITVDFNKSYNPYCAYASGWNCPVPPSENFIPIELKAGEKKYRGKYKERK